MREMQWTEVKRKPFLNAHSRWDVFPRNWKPRTDEEKKVISVFCSNFLDRVKAEDLFDLFGCVGKCVEVAISPRRNKWGKRFGFGRFREEGDTRMLAVRLDAIQIDGVKIYANIPRFERKKVVRGKVSGGEYVAESKGGSEVCAAKEGAFGGVLVRNPGRLSFVEVVASQREAVADQGEGVARSCDFEYKSEPGVKAVLEKAFVGVVSNPGNSYNIQDQFFQEGYFQIKITPLGANLCLLEEEEEGDIEVLIKEAESWWKQWFVKIRPWNVLDVDTERTTWIRFFGVPCHAWKVEFFEKLVQTFGTYICSDESITERSGMEVARVLVRIPIEFMVSVFVNAKVDGVTFRLRLREEFSSLCNVVRKEAQVEESESEDSVSVGDVSRCSYGSFADDFPLGGSPAKEVREEVGVEFSEGEAKETEENPAVNGSGGLPRQINVNSKRVISTKEPFSFDQAIVAAKGNVGLSNDSTSIKEAEDYVANEEGSSVKRVQSDNVVWKGPTSEVAAGKRMKRIKFKKVGCNNGPKCIRKNKSKSFLKKAHDAKREARKDTENRGQMESDPISIFSAENGNNTKEGEKVQSAAAYGVQSEESIIRRNNSRLKENFGSNVGKKLWKMLSDLGVEKSGAEDCVVELDKMEMEERNRVEVRKENNFLFK
ncbi:uncharacterized protein LOC131623292 [Vicia villosa]|uniref:uncharacterized protein LOC131623292 n=1 Tax=Vicia villosa TaxID=3911 RepID=UPI00273B6123|nr:uncharacterized protein LOC131623292 [Vicia villosa]